MTQPVERGRLASSRRSPPACERITGDRRFGGADLRVARRMSKSLADVVGEHAARTPEDVEHRSAAEARGRKARAQESTHV